MKLRQIINGSLFALAILGVGTALLLVLLTSYLNRTVQLLQDTMGDVRIVERVESDLRTFNYRSNVFYVTGDDRYQALRAETETSLTANLTLLDEYLETDEERALLVDVEETVLEYLAVRRELEASGLSLARVVEQSTPVLDAALRAVRVLVETQLIEADRATLEAARWDRWANVWALATAAALLLGIAIVLAVVHQKVYMPLWRMREAIHEFGTGNEDARVEPVGPPELREIGETFNQVADSLRRQRENRVAFLGSVAHDLRNPLTAIRGYTELIGRKETLPSETEIRHMADIIRRQVLHLTRMLDDFLDTARLETGRLELRLVEADARQLPQASAELFKVFSDKHDIRLSATDEVLPVSCDPYRIEQVLNNLISNAVKYSPEGGPVSICVEREGDTALFSVTDQGLGIAPDELDHLYQPFRRLSSAPPDVPGAGLGLSVVRRIVDAHGGTVGVESTVGEGSTFWFKLPLLET